MSDSPDRVPELRASDADRERVVDMLRRAASDGHLTVEELEERASSAYAARTRRVVSIMGGHDKRGRWRLAPRCTVLNIMGGSDIDVNDAELSGPLTKLNMYSIMGGGDIRVPQGVDVHVSNFALMGANDVNLGDKAAPPGAPTIHIRLVSIMGGSNVARGRKPTREERRRERELRKARRRDLGP